MTTVNLAALDGYVRNCAPRTINPLPDDEHCYPMVLIVNEISYYGNANDDQQYKNAKCGRWLKLTDPEGNKYFCTFPSVYQSKEMKQFLGIIQAGDFFYARACVTTNTSFKDHGEHYLNIYELVLDEDASWDIYSKWKANGSYIKRKPQTLTDDEIKEIRKMAQNGKTDKQIAEETGHSTTTVAKYANQHASELPEATWMELAENFAREAKKTSAKEIKEYLYDMYGDGIAASVIYKYFKENLTKDFYVRRNGANYKDPYKIDLREVKPTINEREDMKTSKRLYEINQQMEILQKEKLAILNQERQEIQEQLNAKAEEIQNLTMDLEAINDKIKQAAGV